MKLTILISVLIPISFGQIGADDQDIATKAPIEYCGCEIDVCAHGDDDIAIDMSQDGGTNYGLQTSVVGWQTPLQWNYAGCISTATRLRFEIEEYGQTIGGFIGGITLRSGYCGEKTFVTQNDITTNFPSISTVGGTGTAINYVYNNLGDTPWGTFYNWVDTCLNPNTYPGIQWVWNNQLSNTMTYVFSFADKADLLKECCQTQQPTPRPTTGLPTPRPTTPYPTTTTTTTTTEQPTIAPTPEECEPLEDYLDRCYCNSTDTFTTTQTGVGGGGGGGIDPVSSLNDGRNVAGAKYFNGNMMNDAQFKQTVYEFIDNYDQNKNWNNNIIYGLIAVNVILIMFILCYSLLNGRKLKYRKKGYVETIEDVDIEQDELVRT